MVKIISNITRTFITVSVILLAVTLLDFIAITRYSRHTEIADYLYQYDYLNKMVLNIELNVINMNDVVKQDLAQRNIADIDLIVLHHDVYPEGENSWSKVDNYHTNGKGWQGIQYHFFISKTGRVYQNHALKTVTIHAGTDVANLRSIGVCVQGNFDIQHLHKEQKKALIQLLFKLRNKAKNPLKLVGHRDIKNTSCPGKNINIAKIDSLSRKAHFLVIKQNF